MLNYQKKKQDVPELINKTSKEGIKYEHQVQRKRSIPQQLVDKSYPGKRKSITKQQNNAQHKVQQQGPIQQKRTPVVMEKKNRKSISPSSYQTGKTKHSSRMAVTRLPRNLLFSCVLKRELWLVENRRLLLFHWGRAPLWFRIQVEGFSSTEITIHKFIPRNCNSILQR